MEILSAAAPMHNLFLMLHGIDPLVKSMEGSRILDTRQRQDYVKRCWDRRGADLAEVSKCS